MKWLRDALIVVCLFALLAYLMRDLRLPGLPMFHDSNPHIARAVNYHTALQDGQYPPMWAKDVMGGIGSPVLMLNYQLPYLLGELWHRLGATVIDSYKMTLGITYILSGILMYGALRASTGRASAWLGAVIYTLAPYRFVDIFVRGALGESVSFLFPPLLILGYTKGSLAIVTLGWAGLFLTHPVAAAVFSAFFWGYTIFFKRNFYWRAYIVALLIAAFNILPTIALTRLTHYSPSLSDTMQMFPTLSQLIHSPWGYGVSLPGEQDGMSFEVGGIAWLVLITSTIIAIVRRNRILGYLSGSCWSAIVLMLPPALPLYSLFLGQIIDFPWRLLICVVFGTAWLGGELLNQLISKPWKKWITIAVTIVLVIQALPIVHTNTYWSQEHGLAFFARETGDSYGEYAPRTRATRESAPFWERAEFVEGTGLIEIVSDRSDEKQFRIVSDSEGVVRINTAFFPGWVLPESCYVTERTLTQIDDSGLIACRVIQGESTLLIRFVAPPVQIIGNLLSLAGIITLVWYLYRSSCPPTTKLRRSSLMPAKSLKS